VMIKKKKQSKFSYFHTGTMLKRGIRSLGSGEYSDETVNFSSFNININHFGEKSNIWKIQGVDYIGL